MEVEGREREGEENGAGGGGFLYRKYEYQPDSSINSKKKKFLIEH